VQAAADPALIQTVAAQCDLAGSEDRVQAALHLLAKLQPASSTDSDAATEVAAETTQALSDLPLDLQQMLAAPSTLPPLPLPLPPSAAAPAAPSEAMQYVSPWSLPPPASDWTFSLPSSLTPDALALPTTTTPFGTFGAANVMAGLQATAADTAPAGAGAQPDGTRRVRQRLA